MVAIGSSLPRLGLKQLGMRALGAFLLAAALALAGCGDGGGVGSTPTPSPTPTPTPTSTPTPTPTVTPSAVFDTSEYRRSDGPAQANAIPAWQLGASGAGVTLAIVDTGIDTTNPEFSGRISAASADVAGSRGLANPDSSHGTQVALVAAAARDNSGIMGIAWGATIQMLRADDPGSCATPRTGTTGGCAFYDNDIATGIDRAVMTGAKVINLSLGGSPPSQDVIEAVGRAANAGTVIVVSAGNDGTSSTVNPDTFAIGIRQAGNGNVIIAGSVDAGNVISSFSNEAGSEQQWYLMARGEQVCCVYENGQIKITNQNGQQFVTVVSGTSFSAPQIAGAVALLRQYFPTLTAAQVVDLLLRTASDAGATGVDTVYGRGLLNIGAAFAPQGTTSLANSAAAQVQVGGSAVTTSAAMGNALRAEGLDTVVLDAYGRAYGAHFTVAAGAGASRLAGALGGEGRNVSASVGGFSMSFALADPLRPGLGRAALPDHRRSGFASADPARVLAASLTSHLAPGMDMALAYAMGADGAVRSLRAAPAPPFMLASDPAQDLGFSRDPLGAVALRRMMGATGLTLWAENGRELTLADPLRQRLAGQLASDGYFRAGLDADRRFGPLAVHLGANWLAEAHGILGAHLVPGFGPGGADSLLLDGDATLDAGGGWYLGAAWRQGWTRARPGGTIAPGSAFASNAWAIDVTRDGVFARDDRLSLRLAQPLRVSGGGLNFLLPASFSYETLRATTAISRLALAPDGREIMSELAWSGPLAGGRAGASLFWRSQPWHDAAKADDLGMGLRWTTGF